MTNFVILGAGKPYKGERHTALRSAGGSINVLGWSLSTVDFLNPVCSFVCGYKSESIKEAYPNFNYIENTEWQNTRAGWSFLLSLNDVRDDSTLVAYSDIVFRKESVKQLTEAKGDVIVAVDSQWRSRYTGRALKDLKRCEKVCFANESITLLGTDIDVMQADAEFIGLALFSKEALKLLKNIKNEIEDESELTSANLSYLIELLRIRGLRVTAVDVKGNWAQLNDPADLAKFILGTKAQTLKRLKKVVTQSRIEDQVSFTVSEWENNSLIWIEKCKQELNCDSLIVRSSALSEDGFLNSSAGLYTSIMHVPSNDNKEIEKAINEVIVSYPDGNPSNEVLVQPMLQSVKVSGVVFTRNLANGAPYYTINYDDVSGSTESITNGSCEEDKTLVIRRDVSSSSSRVPKNLDNLLPALREIEYLLGYDSLDIEFAITADQGLYILQVRPIAVNHEDFNNSESSDSSFYSLLNSAESEFLKQQQPSPFVVGKRALFGVMPDWNPAEIIGKKPSVLATTLYRNLILDEVWATQRAEYGYRDVRPQPLLTSFAGQPYINIRASLNSFIPATVSDQLAEKLVDFCSNWLESHPELHDKVEFDVIPTCFDLEFNKWEERLTSQAGFSISEVSEIKKALLELTLNALDRNKKDLDNIDLLEKRYELIKNSKLPPLERAFILLDDARRFGTLPFAHLARSAFVAVSLLRSAVSVGAITEADRDDFLNSIYTVSKGLAHDSIACANGQLSWNTFVEKYGHLRPGTYDITSASYRQDPERYLKPTVQRAKDLDLESESKVGERWAKARKDFESAAIEAGISVTANKLETFLREAIEGREYAKFAFTRNLSLALDDIQSWAESYSIDNNTLSQLSIDDLKLISRGSVPIKNVAKWIRNRAKANQKHNAIREQIELPPLLCNTDDFSIFLYPTTHANYIGSSTVTASCVDIENNNEEIDLEGKIVLIPQADPGFDWLFGRNIAGLITMYGGANSHMAIRAAEFGLPAAIGIGETHYRSLSNAIELELNTGQRLIRVIH